MRSDSSQRLYRKKFYPENLENLLKIKQKYSNTSQPVNSTSTLPRFTRPASESRFLPSRIALSSREKSSSHEKLYNKLSTQLKEIKESIASLSSHRRKKKSSKKKSKVITEVSEIDPKTKIYQQVLRQIKEIKERRHDFNHQPQPQPQPQPQSQFRPRLKTQPKLPDRSSLERYPEQSRRFSGQDVEKTLFYGVDLICGIQFKIKVKLGREKYCLMAKNHYTKMMIEMPANEYLSLNHKLFHGNPTAIFKYLIIDSNQLKLRKAHAKDNSSVRSFVAYT